MLKTIKIDLPPWILQEIRRKAIHDSTSTTNINENVVIENILKNYYNSRKKD